MGLRVQAHCTLWQESSWCSCSVEPAVFPSHPISGLPEWPRGMSDMLEETTVAQWAAKQASEH